MKVQPSAAKVLKALRMGVRGNTIHIYLDALLAKLRGAGKATFQES